MTPIPPAIKTRIPSRWWGWIIAAASIVAIWFLVIILFAQYRESRNRAQYYDALSSVQKASFDAWLDEPLPLSDNVWEPPAVPSSGMVLQREALKKDFAAINDKIRWVDPAQKLISNHNLELQVSPQQLQEFDFLTTAVAPLIPLARQLTAMPDYIANRAEPFVSYEFDQPQVFDNVLGPYILTIASKGQWDDACNALDLTLRINRQDQLGNGLSPYFSANCALQAARLAQYLASKTSDTVQLNRLTSILINNREGLSPAQIDWFPDNDDIFLARWLFRQGWISKPMTTRRQLISARWIYGQEYIREISRATNPADSRRKRELWSYGRTDIGDPYYYITFRPLNGIIRYLRRAEVMRHCYREWSNYQTGSAGSIPTETLIRQKFTIYDLVTMHVARSADMEKEVVVPPDLLAPRENGKERPPLRFSPDKKAFFSVGPDGLPNTADDIFLKNQ